SLDPDVVKRGLFHNVDPDFHTKVSPGDVLVAGHNFGCGSSRETSIQCLKLHKIGAIVAMSFARIFFRNATNHGLPCLTFCRAEDRELLRTGQQIEVSFERWTLCGPFDEAISLEPVGEFVRSIWRAGGLLAMLPTTHCRAQDGAPT